MSLVADLYDSDADEYTISGPILDESNGIPDDEPASKRRKLDLESPLSVSPHDGSDKKRIELKQGRHGATYQGGYVAKRFRELSHRTPQEQDPLAPASSNEQFVGFIPSNVEATRIPATSDSTTVAGRVHSAAVNCVRWSPSGRLFATASMDKTCIIWEAPEAKPYPSVRADFFEGAVRHVDWRRDSTNLATCGFEKSVRFLDVATARCVSQVCTPEYVTCAKFHPEHDHLLVGGMFSSGLFCWDVRANQLVRRYNSDLGMIHDLIFPAADPTHQQFLSCPDVTKRSAVDKSIFAWDFNSAAPMFYQIYHEAYTCTALRQHPRSGQICAQSSAGYIIVLENKPPYKLNRSKRFEGHSMSGLRVGFDVASDGKTVFSGSSTGDCVAYNWGTAKLAWRWKAHVANCVEVACHPHTRNQVVTASSDGTVRLWDTTNMGRSVHEPT